MMHSPKKILIADDCPDTLFLISKLFTDLGTNVKSVSGGLPCVDLALGHLRLQEPFDLIVVDMKMPDLSGSNAAKEIREGGHTGPIIAFTSHATMKGRKDCLNNGINGYFNKSVIKKELLSALLETY